MWLYLKIANSKTTWFTIFPIERFQNDGLRIRIPRKNHGFQPSSDWLLVEIVPKLQSLQATWQGHVCQALVKLRAKG